MLKHVLYILIPGLFAAGMLQAGDEQPDPFEPLVTAEEGKQLTGVLGVAATNTVEAVRLLREIAGPEKSPAIDFTLGNLLFQEDKLEEAAQSYRTAVEKMPHFRAALMNLGRVYLLLDQPEKTIGVYQNLVKDGQATADILLLLGHAMLMEDEAVGAETAYRQALLLNPVHTEIRIGLAKALLRQERYTEGRALVTEILKREPLNRELWSLRVNALLSGGDTDSAIRSIDLARRLDRATPEMLATLGDLLLNADRPADALAAYEQAFGVEEPSITRMLRAVEGFLMVGDTDKAGDMIVMSGKALEKHGSPVDELRLLKLRAQLALDLQQYGRARDLCKQVLREDPLDGESLMILGELQAAGGEHTDAILTCERAARVRGFEVKAMLLQARIEVNRGNYDRAVPLLESAQAFEPREYVARYLEQVRRLAE